jgi:hypothetical protein
LPQNSLQNSAQVAQNQRLPQTFFTGFDPVNGIFCGVNSLTFAVMFPLKCRDFKFTGFTSSACPLGNSVKLT